MEFEDTSKGSMFFCGDNRLKFGSREASRFILAKAAFASHDISDASWWDRSWSCIAPSISRTNSLSAAWIPPDAGSLKFNVDGASRGNPKRAGCGGVLRDDNGKLLS
ncbi:hypothetical protein J1N35_006504 [Gossypium stocksii]|uniref:RNase H type-1 domain-containing protein n=1 Tax=Gossypium stocksii TaxID=47602 RepID=A0A9D3WET8_9ROSI|nr:hypothetical protein J1N35_006504 [Gossypium stocksii]